MNNLISLSLFIIIPIMILFFIIIWSACALGKKADKITENAVIKMMEYQRNITSGSAVIKE